MGTFRFLSVLGVFLILSQLCMAGAILDVVETPDDNYLITACDDTDSSIVYWQCRVDATSGGVYMFRDFTDSGDGAGGHTDYLNEGAYNRKCPLIYFDGRGGNIFTRSGTVAGAADRVSFEQAADGSSFTIRYSEDENSTGFFHSSYNDGDISLTPGDLITDITLTLRPPTTAGTMWDWSIINRNISDHGVSAKTWADQSMRMNIYSSVIKSDDSENSRVNGSWDPIAPMSFARYTIGENTTAGFTQGRQFINDYRADMEGYAGGGTISTGTWASFDYLKYSSPYNLTSNYALQPGDSRRDYGQYIINICEPTVGAAPTADAGVDQNFVIHTVAPQTVTLDGSGSFDSDGQIVSYQWRDISGELLGTSDTLTMDLDEGKYFITLTVTDNDGNIDSDEMVVDVVFEWDPSLYDAWPGRDPLDPNQLTSVYGQDIVCPQYTDLSWPENYGDAELCMYKGDKFAACSITVDDNTVPNHDFWLEQADLYGFDVTWFVIVGSHRLNSGNGYFGTWESFQSLYESGHDVQSHTMSHSSDDASRPDDELRWEYSYSRALIDANIADGHCLTLAYPSGSGKPDIAAEYYIAARGTTGSVTMPHTITTRIMNTGTSGLSQLPEITSTSGASPRGWINPLWHLINDEAAMADTLASYSMYYSNVWFGSFTDVAKYLQEFYTATMTINSSDETNGISITLTDRMFDWAFDYPLTIKAKLWPSWTQCFATQDGQPVDCQLLSRHGELYALVQAVPDRGPIMLTPSETARLAGDANDDGIVDLDDFIILKQNYGTTGATVDTGDFNGDGEVNLDDFIILKQNYGNQL